MIIAGILTEFDRMILKLDPNNQLDEMERALMFTAYTYGSHQAIHFCQLIARDWQQERVAKDCEDAYSVFIATSYLATHLMRQEPSRN